MSITGQPVAVIRYTTDKRGNRVEASRHTVTRTAFSPRPVAAGRGSAELTDRAVTVTADAELYVPHGADIRPADVIELTHAPYTGTRWEVAGALESWQSPFGTWRPGAVVPLRRKTG